MSLTPNSGADVNNPTDYPLFLDEPANDADNDFKAQYAQARWNAQREYYSGIYRYWSKAILFLLGKQWLRWNKTQRNYTTELNLPKWRQQPVTNFCYAVYRSALAKLKKQRPAFTCVPASGDTDDRNAANLGDALLKYWWRSLKLSVMHSRLVGWVLTTGSGYVNVCWDAQAGEIRGQKTTWVGEDGDEIEAPADDQGDPILGDDGKPDRSANGHRIAIGEISVSLVSPMCVRHNPDAESPEDAIEWYVGEVMPTPRAAATFKMDVNLIGGNANDELVTTLDMITAATTGAIGPLNLLGGSDNTTAQGQRSLVIRYYRKPNDDYPDGRYWVSVDGKMWPKGELALPYGFWPPLVPVQDVPVPGQPQSMGMLGQVVPLNEAYNTVDGQIKENNVTVGKGGKWMLHPDDKSLKIDSDPGQVLISKGYASGHPPAQLPPQALPAEVIREREVYFNNITMISGLGDIGLGSKPEGVTAGRAFLVLQEATDAVIGPTSEAIEIGLEEIGRRCLVLASRYYKEERTVKIGGENGVWQFRAFQGSDLSDSMDVSVQIGSSFPWSKAARQDTALQMLSTFPGLVSDPQTGVVNPQKLAKYINIGGIEAFESENDPDLDEIEREHAQFEDPIGGIPQIGFWQDHPAHYAGHANFLKRDRERFDRWPQERQHAFIQHVLETQQVISEGLASMMPQAAPPDPMAAQGQPQGNQPSGPQGMPSAGASVPPQPSPTPGSDVQLMSSDRAAA